MVLFGVLQLEGQIVLAGLEGSLILTGMSSSRNPPTDIAA